MSPQRHPSSRLEWLQGLPQQFKGKVSSWGKLSPHLTVLIPLFSFINLEMNDIMTLRLTLKKEYTSTQQQWLSHYTCKVFFVVLKETSLILLINFSLPLVLYEGIKPFISAPWCCSSESNTCEQVSVLFLQSGATLSLITICHYDRQCCWNSINICVIHHRYIIQRSI